MSSPVTAPISPKSPGSPTDPLRSRRRPEITLAPLTVTHTMAASLASPETSTIGVIHEEGECSAPAPAGTIAPVRSRRSSALPTAGLGRFTGLQPSTPTRRRMSLTLVNGLPSPRGRMSQCLSAGLISGNGRVFRLPSTPSKVHMTTREVCMRKANRRHRRHQAIHIPKDGDVEGALGMVRGPTSPALRAPPASTPLDRAQGGRRTISGVPAPLPSPLVNASFTFGKSTAPSMDRYITREVPEEAARRPVSSMVSSVSAF